VSISQVYHGRSCVYLKSTFDIFRAIDVSIRYFSYKVSVIEEGVIVKDDVDQVNDLLPYFDWALDEQCFQYKECDKLLPFISLDKAVMEVEYKLNPSQFCSKANAMNFKSMKKRLNLGLYRVACR